MNLYTPERQTDESQAAYRHRRQQAKRAVNAMRCVGMSGGTSQREQMRKSRRRLVRVVETAHGIPTPKEPTNDR